MDTYINEVISRNVRVRVITINGYQMCGKIIAEFDDHIILKVDNCKKMIFKHAISTIEAA